MTALAVVSLRLSSTVELPGTNTRHTYAEAPLAELTASIKLRGVEQPIHVRPLPDGTFAVVAGFRRRRAAIAAGLESIPAFVREFTDEEALEWNLVENLQRADPHPIEEAEGFQRLLEQFGHTVAQVAQKTGKSAGHVHKRLQLLRLTKAARTAYLSGKLLDAVALLLATIPPKLQDEALKGLTSQRDPLGLHSARAYLDRNFRLRLKEAPFSLSDGDLLPGTPSCNACPKRTGNAPQLFDDASPKDLCTDPGCFQAKSSAAWVCTAEKALAKGWEVLSEEDSAALFQHGPHLAYSAPFVEASWRCLQDRQHRTWGELVGPFKPQFVLARDSYGTVHRLIRKDDAEAILRYLQPEASSATATPDTRAQAAQLRKAQRQRRDVFSLALSRVSTTAAEAGPSDDLLRFLAAEALASAHFDTQRAVAKLRGLSGSPHEVAATLTASVKTMSGAEALGLLTQVLASRWAFSSHVRDCPPALGHALEVLSLDLSTIERECLEQQEAADRLKKDGRPCPRCQQRAKRFVLRGTATVCLKCNKALEAAGTTLAKAA